MWDDYHWNNILVGDELTKQTPSNQKVHCTPISPGGGLSKGQSSSKLKLKVMYTDSLNI